jgi:hypothetical protein
MLKRLLNRIHAELLIKALLGVRTETLAQMVHIEWTRFRMRCRAVNRAVDMSL